MRYSLRVLYFNCLPLGSLPTYRLLRRRTEVLYCYYPSTLTGVQSHGVGRLLNWLPLTFSHWAGLPLPYLLLVKVQRGFSPNSSLINDGGKIILHLPIRPENHGRVSGSCTSGDSGAFGGFTLTYTYLVHTVSIYLGREHVFFLALGRTTNNLLYSLGLDRRKGGRGDQQDSSLLLLNNLDNKYLNYLIFFFAMMTSPYNKSLYL